MASQSAATQRSGSAKDGGAMTEDELALLLAQAIEQELIARRAGAADLQAGH